ncbi:fish-egg lectin-like [Cyprinodon tularosa]|uniref:fish-egg lectin-like n=1 Tax=Cyprinodon tularosa TaxID=77115 RepID=UPI0018E26A92|nr:fish-egg lectin-like [Cyprinodon tularosa]XP_038137860.1 fish-egg lectin-like [Cyprinodon tularosa]XP_038137861.1 fish-egg lectin-like [Cyprinodon tularosa]
MRAVAIFLVLVNFTGCHGLTCEVSPLHFSAVQLDAGQGMVVMTDTFSNVFFLSGSSWTKLGSVPLKHVSVGPAGIWGVNNDDQVYKFSGGDFFPLSGLKLNQLDAGGEGHVVGVTDSDSIHCVNASNVSPTEQEGSLNWITLPGALMHFSCGPNTCWGVNSNQDIYFIKILPNSCFRNEWTHIEGKAVKAEVGSNGRVFVVNKGGNLYERIGISNKTPGGANWKHIEFEKPIKYVSYDLGRLWIVTECNLILECTE